MMNKKEFVAFFQENVLPNITVDYPAIAEAWNDLTDAMVKDRQLPERALNWSNPFDKRKN